MTLGNDMTMGNGEDDPPGADGGAAPTSGIGAPKQSPFFLAAHQARYYRQDLIRQIQTQTDRKLICYVAESAPVTRDDVVPIMDLLHHIGEGDDIDFLINTRGGDVDAADKIIRILQRRTGPKGILRVIIPDVAKSAGTLMALGSDLIVMSDSSELGPIDPQIFMRAPNGYEDWCSAQTYVDGFTVLMEKIDDPKSYEAEQRTDAEQLLLTKCDPALLDLCQQSLIRSREMAENLLKRGMLQDGTWTAVAGKVTNNANWNSQHGAVIDFEDARNIGLRIDYLPPSDTLWQAYWRLYCQQRLALVTEGQRKLFESDFASLLVPE